MKVPLRYQNTEYDCGTTSFINALAYLYEREDIPVEILKMIYKYTLDVERKEIIGLGGTSKDNALKLSKLIVKSINKHKNINLKCRILTKEEVNIDNMKDILSINGVIIARCYQKSEHYVIITKIDDNFAYIFDPYYLEEDYYVDDDEVSIVLHETFTHNRVVKLSRLFDNSKKDFSLLPLSKREVIIFYR